VTIACNGAIARAIVQIAMEDFSLRMDPAYFLELTKTIRTKPQTHFAKYLTHKIFAHSAIIDFTWIRTVESVRK
jgi:hypothetical protein